MRRTKANRALTFVMAAALLIGSIHGVGAKEQSKAYDAPELTLTQGVTDYDLTEGIAYDSENIPCPSLTQETLTSMWREIMRSHTH